LLKKKIWLASERMSISPEIRPRLEAATAKARVTTNGGISLIARRM
jgi:hypothetical protein